MTPPGSDPPAPDGVEDRLRAAVEWRAAAVPVGDERDGLAAVQARLRAGRRPPARRRAAVALALAAALVVVAGVAVLLRQGEPARVQTTGGQGPGSATTVPGATTVPPENTTAPPPTTNPGAGGPAVALWPPAGREPYPDPVAAARSFVEEYVGSPDPPLGEFRPTGGSTGEVDVHLRGEGGRVLTDRVVATVSLARVAGGWTVDGARSADLVVVSPGPLDVVGPTVVVDGRGRAYEGTIVVSVVDGAVTAGPPLAEGLATAGASSALEPFRVELTLTRRPVQASGSILLRADTGCGECNAPFTVVPVRFGPPG